MSSGNLRIRRATLDDLPVLRPLWTSMRFDVSTLEKRLTEYQVAVDEHEQVIGGMALQIVGRQALVHSEAFPDFSAADPVRPKFWERIQALALNHGIARLWTREQAPFWKQNGFQPADADSLKRLPAEFGDASAHWLTLPLKDEDSVSALDKEFALFMSLEKQRTQRAFKQAKTLKTIATLAAFLFALLVLAATVYLVRRNAQP